MKFKKVAALGMAALMAASLGACGGSGGSGGFGDSRPSDGHGGHRPQQPVFKRPSDRLLLQRKGSGHPGEGDARHGLHRYDGENDGAVRNRAAASGRCFRESRFCRGGRFPDGTGLLPASGL